MALKRLLLCAGELRLDFHGNPWLALAAQFAGQLAHALASPSPRIGAFGLVPEPKAILNPTYFAQQWGQTMLWRIALGWAKSVTLLALFSVVNRIAISTGLRTSLVDPLAVAVSHVSGLAPNYSVLLMIAVSAVGLLKVVIAIARAAAATVRR